LPLVTPADPDVARLQTVMCKTANTARRLLLLVQDAMAAIEAERFLEAEAHQFSFPVLARGKTLHPFNYLTEICSIPRFPPA
jgi:hypothetical protein